MKICSHQRSITLDNGSHVGTLVCCRSKRDDGEGVDRPTVWQCHGVEAVRTPTSGTGISSIEEPSVADLALISRESGCTVEVEVIDDWHPHER